MCLLLLLLLEREREVLDSSMEWQRNCCNVFLFFFFGKGRRQEEEVGEVCAMWERDLKLYICYVNNTAARFCLGKRGDPQQKRESMECDLVDVTVCLLLIEMILHGWLAGWLGPARRREDRSCNNRSPRSPPPPTNQKKTKLWCLGASQKGPVLHALVRCIVSYYSILDLHFPSSRRPKGGRRGRRNNLVPRSSASEPTTNPHVPC